VAHLFRHGDTKDLEQDLEAWGAPPEVLAQIEQAQAFEVWPENVLPIQIFMRLQTQWRHGFSGPTGLDYTGVRAGLAMMGVEATAGLFEDLQTMERATLALWSEVRGNES